MQHFHQASYQHSMVSGFYPVEDGAVIDEETATYRATHPELGAHYGRTIGTCRCNLLVMQLCREGDTGFSNRRGWVPVNDIAAAYAEHAQRNLESLTGGDLYGLGR